MNNKEIIIQLLIQDMKHQQLMDALHQLGFDKDIHTLNLMDITSQLMGVEEQSDDNAWSDTYMEFMKQAKNFDITPNGENLQALAETCYLFLQAK